MSLQSDYLTFDIMSEVVFGMEYDALRQAKFRYVMPALEASNVRISALVQASCLSIARLDKLLFPASIKGRNRFLGFITRLLKERSRLRSHTATDVFDFLTTAKDPHGGSTLSADEIRAESATLVVAGSDTSSTTLSGTLFYLSRNRRSYARARNEVFAAFQHVDAIQTGKTLNSCVYLRACIDEALRMSPPVGGALWREICTRGLTIESMSLPKGIDVGVGIYSIHDNAIYFPDPFEYRPERWLVDEPENTRNAVDLSKSAFYPFSLGPWSCVGKGFAYCELMLTLAHILFQFEFVTEASESMDSGESLLRDHVTSAKDGPVLIFQPRQI